MKNIVRYWVPLYLYAAVIFVMSSISKPLPDIGVPQFDKVLHLVEYAVFGFLASRAFRNSSSPVFIENFKVLAMVITFIYGLSDEFHQFFVPGRDGNVFEMLIDGIGGIIGTFVYSRGISKLP